MAEFSVVRSVQIGAPAAAIYPHLIDFHAWRNWSPWEGVDPNLQRTYSGPAAGPGAVYGWRGNRKAGAGRMEITDVTEPTHVGVELQFIKPWKATNEVAFDLAESGDSTEVTWTMRGVQTRGQRIFGALVGGIDKLVGKDFENGLAALKELAEAGTPAPTA